MNNQELYWIIAPILGILIIIYLTYNEWYKNKKKYSNKNLFQYIYLVIFSRIRYRMVGIFLLIPLTVNSGVIYIILVDKFTPVLKIEQMQTDIGIVKSINHASKGSDTIKIVHDNGTTQTYNILSSKERRDLYVGHKVKIYYQHRWRVVWFENWVWAIEYINPPLHFEEEKSEKIHYEEKRYNSLIEWKKTSFSFLKYLVTLETAFILVLFLLNYKETPKHRLNRIKRNKMRENG